MTVKGIPNNIMDGYEAAVGHIYEGERLNPRCKEIVSQILSNASLVQALASASKSFKDDLAPKTANDFDFSASQKRDKKVVKETVDYYNGQRIKGLLIQASSYAAEIVNIEDNKGHQFSNAELGTAIAEAQANFKAMDRELGLISYKPANDGLSIEGPKATFVSNVVRSDVKPLLTASNDGGYAAAIASQPRTGRAVGE